MRMKIRSLDFFCFSRAHSDSSIKIRSFEICLFFRSTSRLIEEKEVISIAHILAVEESSKHGAPDIKKFDFSQDHTFV